MNTYAIERVVGDVAVERRLIGELRKKDAVQQARTTAAQLSSRQAQSSIVRLLTQEWEPRRLEPVAAFRKHPTSGRVTRI